MIYNDLSRRKFLKLSSLAFAYLMMPNVSLSNGYLRDKRRISLHNITTQEKLLDICYFNDGSYSESALEEISHLFRDSRTGEIKPIDPRLLDYIHDLKQISNHKFPFNLVSGYRSKRTNNHLIKRNKLAVKNSYHTKGMAADLIFARTNLRKISFYAQKLKRGGVGYYPKAQFIHLDSANFRFWKS